jgi:hypothetical protein
MRYEWVSKRIAYFISSDNQYVYLEHYTSWNRKLSSLKQIIWNLYTRSGSIKGRQSLDFSTFSILELCPLFTLAGSGSIHVLWTHSIIIVINTFIHLSHTLSYHFVFLKYLIAPDILYLIKKAEKRISSQQRLNIVEFKHKIMWYHSLEQYISKKNNTILAFEKMWTPLQYIFN